jgi:5-methylcytosine-specific restriction protein A
MKIYGKSKYVDLKGVYNEQNGHVVIFAKSKYRLDKTKSLLPHIIRYRETVLNEIGSVDGLTTKDYEFKSPGAAACVLCGTMINGLDFFVLDDKRTLNEYFSNTPVAKRKAKKENGDSEKEMPLFLPDNKKYKRIYSVGKTALKNSGFSCFVDASHDTFITDDGLPYMEAHHLIPFKYQKDFEYSLQVQANVVCLCPKCHRELHYGKDRAKVLKVLYDDRKESLRKCGIDISFEQLLSYYDLKRNKTN